MIVRLHTAGPKAAECVNNHTTPWFVVPTSDAVPENAVRVARRVV